MEGLLASQLHPNVAHPWTDRCFSLCLLTPLVISSDKTLNTICKAVTPKHVFPVWKSLLRTSYTELLVFLPKPVLPTAFAISVGS